MNEEKRKELEKLNETNMRKLGKALDVVVKMADNEREGHRMWLQLSALQVIVLLGILFAIVFA